MMIRHSIKKIRWMIILGVLFFWGLVYGGIVYEHFWIGLLCGLIAMAIFFIYAFAMYLENQIYQL